MFFVLSGSYIDELFLALRFSCVEFPTDQDE
jgi:hypothetical protein